MTIDAHAHASDLWFEPVEALLFQLRAHSVDRAVLVQQSGCFDNSYVQSWIRREPERFASVVVVDVKSPDAASDLESLAADGATGVRFMATSRSPGGDQLAIWRTASLLGLTVSCLGSPADYVSPAFTELLEQLPTLPIVIEHLGERQKLGMAYSPEKASGVYELARFPNVYMKIHGLGEFTPRERPQQEYPFIRPVPALLGMAVKAFGPERIVWGSDFPTVSSREGYGLSLHLTRSELANQGVDDYDLDLIFGGTAKRLFWR